MNKLIVFFLLLYLILPQCSIPNENNKISEGTIFYKIAYYHPQVLDVPQELLPGIMVMKFNNRYTNSTIEGFMGLFAISILSDLKEANSITMLKVFDKKYYYQGAVIASPDHPENPGTIKITLLDDEKIIAGLKCKKAQVEYVNQEKNPFSVYYTTEIGPKNPNINTRCCCHFDCDWFFYDNVGMADRADICTNTRRCVGGNGRFHPYRLPPSHSETGGRSAGLHPAHPPVCGQQRMATNRHRRGRPACQRTTNSRHLPSSPR
jgi:hypothetical protein